jgi:small subunit ribosomal protein S20
MIARIMATSKSGIKSYKQAERKRVFNLRTLRNMKAAIKSVKTLIVEKNKDDAVKELPGVYKAIDKAAKRGIIKKNNAAHKKSKITKAIDKIS